MHRFFQIVIFLVVISLPLKAQDVVRSIAVTNFIAHGVPESETAVITEQFCVELSKDTRVQLLERNRMAEILTEQGFQQTGCTENDCAVEIGQLLGVNVIIVGTVGVAGSYTVISSRALDVATGKVLANESVRTKGGVDRILETGVRIIAVNLVNSLVTGNSQSHDQTLKTKPGLKKAILIGSSGAVLVTAVVIGAFIISKEDEPSAPNPNTILVLP